MQRRIRRWPLGTIAHATSPRRRIASWGILVAALNACDSDAPWDPLLDAPAGPSALHVTRMDTWTWRLDWVDNASNETGFNVYWSIGTGIPIWLMTATPADSTTSVHSFLMPAKTLHFRVHAFNVYGESATFASGSLTTPPAGVIVVSPTSVEFEYTIGDRALPPPQTVSVDHVASSTPVPSVFVCRSFNPCDASGADWSASGPLWLGHR